MPMLTRALNAQAPTFVDPYEAQIAELQRRMQQPVPPQFTPEQIEQRRAQNVYEHDYGLLGQLSGDETLGQIGGTYLKRALAAREPKITERGTVNPLTGEFTYDPDYLRRLDEDRLGRLQERSAAARQQWERERTAAQERRDLQQERLEQQMLMRQALGAAGVSAGDARVWRAEDQLRGDFDKLTKDLRDELHATSKLTGLLTAASTARRPLNSAEQMSTVFLLNKFLDPGSVVREGEYDRVVNMQGWIPKAQLLMQRVTQGAVLTPEMAQQIGQLAEFYNRAASDKIRKVAQDYDQIARQRNLNSGAIITDPMFRPGAAPATTRDGSTQQDVIDVGRALGVQPQPGVLPRAKAAAGGGAGRRQVQVEY